MIKRIDLFMPVRSQYGVLHHFTEKLYEALTRAGVNCRILVPDKLNPRPFLAQLFGDPPDFTLSFNGVLPDEEGRFLCDMLKIHHVCCLVDSPMEFIPLIKSPYNIITCVDRSRCDFFKKLGHEKVIFMPHAVEKNLSHFKDEPRTFDVLFLGSCIDYRPIEQKWRSQYPTAISQLLFQAAEITLSDQEIPFYQGLVQATEELKRKHPEIDINHIDFISLLDELETYVVGYDRIRLLKHIKDARIDIFGNSKSTWESYLKSQSNCVFHESVPFEKALDLMKHAKIVLNSFFSIKAGGHERIFSGMAAGAVLVASENNYMRETFKDFENILFYTTHGLNEVNDKVNAILLDDNKRQAIAKKGQETVMLHHTWDHRCSSLLKSLSSYFTQP